MWSTNTFSSLTVSDNVGKESLYSYTMHAGAWMWYDNIPTKFYSIRCLFAMPEAHMQTVSHIEPNLKFISQNMFLESNYSDACWWTIRLTFGPNAWIDDRKQSQRCESTKVGVFFGIRRMVSGDTRDSKCLTNSKFRGAFTWFLLLSPSPMGGSKMVNIQQKSVVETLFGDDDAVKPIRILHWSTCW